MTSPAKKLKRHERKKPTDRRGAVLVCALVILGVVALVTIQSLQTTFVLHRADDTAARIGQAREVLRYSRAALLSKLENGNDLDSVSWRIEVREGEQAQVEVVSSEADELFQLKVTFPIDAPESNQVTVSEQVEWTGT